MTASVITINGLTKRYGRSERPAVDALDLDVAKGEVLAFIGPNGAGKTTTIYSLLGMLRPDAGTISVLGRPGGDREARRQLGFQPEIFNSYPYLTAEQTVCFYGRLSGVPEVELVPRARTLLERLGLGDTGRKKIGSFSKGMNQRLGLASALVHQPTLLVLDEPTTGLDPAGRKLVSDIIEEQKHAGTTIMLSSHILSDVERSCDRVVMIKAGKLVMNESLANLNAGEEERWEIDVGVEADGAVEAIQGAGGTLTVQGADRTVACTADTKRAVMQALAVSGVEIGEIRRVRRSLEDRYMSIMEGQA